MCFELVENVMWKAAYEWSYHMDVGSAIHETALSNINIIITLRLSILAKHGAKIQLVIGHIALKTFKNGHYRF